MNTGVDLTDYGRQQQAVRQQFDARSAANAFSRGLGQRHHKNLMADFNRGFDQQQGGFNASFAQRGAMGGGLRSGVYQRAMQDRLGDYNRQFGRMNEAYQNDMRQFDFNQSNFAAERDRQLADIEAQMSAQRASTAAMLRALQPYLGGF